MTDAVPGRRAPASSRRGRRRHPAAHSRIAAVGVGATSLFGLVAAMGVADALEPAPAPAAPSVASPPANTPAGAVVVVVHHTASPAAPLDETAAAPATEPATDAAPHAAPAPTPVVLSARPEVQVVAPRPAAAPAPAAPAPTARTSGSR